MKRYDSYKDSGVNWIGAIPTHWIKKKLGYSIETIVPMRDKPTSLQGEIPWIRIEDYNGKYIYGSKSNQGVSIDLINEMNLKVYPINTVLTTCSCSFGTTMIVKEPMTSNQTFIGLFPNKIDLDEEFLYYQLHIWKDELDRISSGSIQQYLSRDNFKALRFLFPPLDEQRKIVVYLDKKTSQIDELIQKKLQKISLLKEYRSTLINQVVTKGLNPNVKMKDSGVDCIGEIPSHWEIKRVKHLIEDEGGIKIGPFGSSLKLDTLTDDGIKVYGQGNVIKNDFTIGNRHIPIERFDSDFSQYEIIEGDVLITMMGTTGKSKVFKREFKKGILDSHLLRLRFKKESFLSDLFVMVLQESDYVFHQLRLNSKGSIMEGLNSSIIKELILFTAPIPEQQQILLYLDEQIVKIESSIQLEKKKIELLKDYRQSLISEIVTGKIKVI